MSSIDTGDELVWSNSTWLAEAQVWIARHLSDVGERIVGRIEQPHIRPWATALRVPTARGNVWFKAVAPRLRHEARLTEFLSTLMPHHTPSLIASEPDGGWMLLEDLGEMLRPSIQSVADLVWWDKALVLYAELQKMAADELDTLSATGVPDRRAEKLRRQWEESIGDVERLRVGDDECLSQENYDRARELWPEVGALQAELDSVGLPNTVAHEDLHDANVFLAGKEGEKRIVLADWGESSLANPLCTLTVLLRSMAYHRGLEESAPEIVAVEERYLSHWESFAAMSELREAARIAKRIGMLHRALTWRNAIMSAPANAVAEYADAAPGWLNANSWTHSTGVQQMFDENNEKATASWGLLRRFVRYYRPHIRLFAVDMTCAFGVASMHLAFPLVTRYILTNAIPDRNLPLILWLIVALIGSYGVSSVLQFIIHYWGHVVGIRMEADMRRDIFSHLQRLSFRFYDQNRTGQIMSRVVNDLNEITELAHHGAEDMFLSIVMFSGALVVLFSIEWRLAVAMLAIVPLMAWFAITRRSSMATAWREVRRQLADVNSQIENSISGNRVVQAFTNEKHEIGKFHVSNTQFKNAKYGAYRTMAVFMTGIGFLHHLMNVIVVGAGGLLIYYGVINVADLLTFLLYINLILTPITRLSNFTQQFEQGMSGFRRFSEIMDETPDIVDTSGAKPLGEVVGRVAFENVTFAYDQGEHVLRDVDLEIPAGHTVALVGPSGAGKTTMCNLIPRFYDVSEGRITVDGADIRNVTLESLRGTIGIVQQDVFLFAGSVRDNIIYGDVAADDDQVVRAAKYANIHEFVDSLPEKYDTNVGEKGVRLSGGQKQRIAIARAFLKNPPILLLDEATASLDNETEVLVQQALAQLATGRTTLVIAHRLSTIKNADHIIVLTDEGIAEQGNHEQLMTNHAIYERLYNAQFKGFVPDSVASTAS